MNTLLTSSFLTDTVTLIGMAEKNIPFSSEIEQWLSSSERKTMGNLQSVFGEKSFAMLILVCMFIPALPVPTGGITTVILIPATVFASFQMMFGRTALWLPQFIAKVKLGDKTIKSALPFMIKRIRWFERFSRPRLADYLTNAPFRIVNGFLIFLFALGSLIAPPFSGLDTLPSLGAVIIALGIILEDVLLIVVGAIVGIIGLGLMVAAAALITSFVQQIF